ncbi:MAG: hypothetical protein Q4E45_05315, partial [Eubacteriales bacterium]|nr:hypothetical protein [Eubacteriales bacterium]
PLTAEDLMKRGAGPHLIEFDEDEKESFGCCLEDINGDGTPELFLGIDNTEFNDQVYHIQGTAQMPLYGDRRGRRISAEGRPARI